SPLTISRHYRPDLVALAQETACPHDDQVAFIEPFADLNLVAGDQPHGNRPRFDAVVAHDLHDRTLRPVEHGRERYRRRADRADLDERGAKSADAKPVVLAEGDAHARRLRLLIDIRRDEAKTSDDLADARDLHARGLPGLKLCHPHDRDLRLKL